MKKLFPVLLSSLLVICGCSQNVEQQKKIPGKTISIKQLEERFRSMSQKPGWDVKQPMLWRYFFTHHEPTLLVEAKSKLVEKGYRFVSIYRSDKVRESDPDQWWLHIEREEIHTPQSLDSRNDEFYILAHELGLDSYDGMDARPIKK